MMISELTKRLEEEKKALVIDSSLVKNIILIISLLLIIFTIIYFTCFGCFLVLNDAGTRTAQTVTLNSEGPAGEMYPDSMGEYQLAGEERTSIWYQHVTREDRFIMYNKLGKFNKKYCNIVYFTTRLSLVHHNY